MRREDGAWLRNVNAYGVVSYSSRGASAVPAKWVAEKKGREIGQLNVRRKASLLCLGKTYKDGNIDHGRGCVE